MSDFETLFEELTKHLDCTRQSWLFGAGVSFESNIPLMYDLTERVKSIVEESDNETDKSIFESLVNDLKENSHVENYLSHLGDLIALSDRSQNGSATVNRNSFSGEQLRSLYGATISAIGSTLRYGYSKKDGVETIGDSARPIVVIEPHRNFVQALFGSKANLISRSKITFFTTNYDTLLEDALSLEKCLVIDGFSGGAVGFWDPEQEYGTQSRREKQVELYKLHGSVDWHRDKECGLVRVRYGTKYFASLADIMIYPQATKYVETQKDPFARMFSGFRETLSTQEDNTLAICGYSFSDDHINGEIFGALQTPQNKTNLVVFAKENVKDGVVKEWLADKVAGKRVYVATEKGLYNGDTSAVLDDDQENLDWWSFAGLTEFLRSGEIR